MVKINLGDWSWIVRGKQRRAVIKCMDEVRIPTQISKECGLSLNHTSRVLREFEKRGLAKCLTPKEKVGRLYKLLERGDKVRQKLIKGNKDC